MAAIKKANLLRVIDNGGRKMGHVEVEVEGIEKPMTALMEKTDGGQYSLYSLQQHNEDYHLDWHENSLHHAYSDVGSELPDELSAISRGGMTREEFTQALLQTGDLLKQLEGNTEQIW